MPSMRTLIPLAVVIAAVAVAGCGKNRKSRDRRGAAEAASTQRTFSLEERLAIEAARDAVAERENWAGRATFDAKRDGDGWLVYVERQPPVPGGHRLVRVDAEGNVVEYMRGE